MQTIPMKNLIRFILCLATLTTSSLFGQDAPANSDVQRARAYMAAMAAQSVQPNLTKFDLDFPGGTPGELAAAIQKAMGRPLNAIVPVEYASRKLPPMKMKGVDVNGLFKALELGSQSTEWVVRGGNAYAQPINYGFRTLDPGPQLSDDSIWSFYETGSQRQQPSVSRFYLLTPYLAGGLSVDDITTAIQTGWRLQGNEVPPKLSFHKETNLLIAVGSHGDLDTIDSVLKALDVARATATTDKSATEVKTKP